MDSSITGHEDVGCSSASTSAREHDAVAFDWANNA
jgi:hypothetical protein